MPFMIIIFYFVSDNKRTESRTEIHREAMPVKPFWNNSLLQGELRPTEKAELCNDISKN